MTQAPEGPHLREAELRGLPTGWGEMNCLGHRPEGVDRLPTGFDQTGRQLFSEHATEILRIASLLAVLPIPSGYAFLPSKTST